mgnify:CR=1 FL=1|jgi:hypothetical protein
MKKLFYITLAIISLNCLNIFTSVTTPAAAPVVTPAPAVMPAPTPAPVTTAVAVPDPAAPPVDPAAAPATAPTAAAAPAQKGNIITTEVYYRKGQHKRRKSGLVYNSSVITDIQYAKTKLKPKADALYYKVDDSGTKIGFINAPPSDTATTTPGQRTKLKGIAVDKSEFDKFISDTLGS